MLLIEQGDYIMDFDVIKEFMTLDKILAFLQDYRSFGPFPGILLPMIEAFFPIFPLFLFVLANAAAFGLWLGFLYSYIGACSGALLVFFIVRRLGRTRLFSFLSRHKKVLKLMNWVERHGFGPLFLMLCFPFTPSSAINIVAALSKVSVAQFVLAVICGKIVMIFTISFIGYDIFSLIKNPTKTIFVLISIFILWFVGKRIEKKLTTKTMSTSEN